MCGLSGVIGPGSRSIDLISAMADRLAHRGPDDRGVWQDPGLPLAFGHRRLAIIDLSPAGHQPMLSANARWAICYNGEIYNHSELRAQLDAEIRIAWRGHSDTETLLEAVAHWGLDRTLPKLVGMFAIALFDRKEGRLHLIRDRFGEKPLYYGWVGKDFLFASELKSFTCHPDFAASIDREALSELVGRGYVPEPRSIYRGIAKLRPSHRLEIDATASPGTSPESRAYWDYAGVVAGGLANPFRDRGQALEASEAAIRESVRGQSIADVPVGVFLSGGIDSSLIAATYQATNSTKVKSFTIGSDETAYDESPNARAIATHLGTEHRELRVSAEDAMAVIPELPQVYDEPFADSSQIPTFLVSRMARETVTVALSGDGGDELFGGYNRYTRLPKMWAMMSRPPALLRKAAGAAVAAMPSSVWNALATLATGGRATDQLGQKIAKFGTLAANMDGIDSVVDAFLDEWSGVGSPVLRDGVSAKQALPLDSRHPIATRLMLSDALGYLPGDILCKVDRASMAHSLECRVPLLDHRVAEVASRIPVQMTIEGGTGKTILRDILARHIPRDLFERPKSGFAIPIGRWLRGPLRDWAEDLLDEKSLSQDGYFDPSIIRARWAMHLSGKVDASQALWSILMFQAWKRHSAIS